MILCIFFIHFGSVTGLLLLLPWPCELNHVIVSGPHYRFASRQLLLLGTMLDFSDSTNRKVASAFVHELLSRPLEHEVDEDGNKVVIGDGINLGGDKDWAKAVSELAMKVHASVGEFEEVVTGVVEELARPCRERAADFMQWMHCLSVTGLLLENIKSIRSTQGKAIEASELLHSILLPGVCLWIKDLCIILVFIVLISALLLFLLKNAFGVTISALALNL